MEWSGNWLNWAATQTIDPFRKALTGGLRVLIRRLRPGSRRRGTTDRAASVTSRIDRVQARGTIAGAMPSNLDDAVERASCGGGNQLFFTSTVPWYRDAQLTRLGALAFRPGTTVLDETGH